MRKRTKNLILILILVIIILTIYFFDDLLIRVIPFLRISFLNPIFIFLGGTIGALIYLAFLSLLLIYQKKKKFIPHLILTFILTLSLVYLLKYTVMRARPDIIPLIIKTTSSFPSAHAAIAASTLLFIKKLRSQLLQILSFIPASLIVLSGFYNGVHYLSDILTGVLIGIVISYFILKKGDIILKRIKRMTNLIKRN